MILDKGFEFSFVRRNLPFKVHLCNFIPLRQPILTLIAFYRSRVFLSGNTHDILFNVNAKKKEKRYFCSAMRAIGNSRYIAHQS